MSNNCIMRMDFTNQEGKERDRDEKLCKNYQEDEQYYNLDQVGGEEIERVLGEWILYWTIYENQAESWNGRRF